MSLTCDESWDTEDCHHVCGREPQHAGACCCATCKRVRLERRRGAPSLFGSISPMANFESDEHALHTGMLVGRLMQVPELSVSPMVDDNGDYLPIVEIFIPDPLQDIKIQVRVLPPKS